MKASKSRKPLPLREAAVCKRLKEVRTTLRLAQSEFADQVGVSRVRLASYEEERAPLRFDLALKICRQFCISEKWLATGEGSARECYDLASDPAAHLPTIDTPYGQAYDSHLSAIYDNIQAKSGGFISLMLHEGEDNFPMVVNWFLACLEVWYQISKKPTIPTGFANGLFSFILEQSSAYIQFAKKHNRLLTADDLVKIKPVRPERSSTKRVSK